MRKVTSEIVRAFLKGESKKIGNSRTDSYNLYLHENKIASFNKDGFLQITAAGWLSNTTKERLNALPNVKISQKNFIWYLNGVAWNGKWIYIDYKR